ncbi:MAG TPA: hypothetical protein V6D29_19780 [Leptolyngbyaceae cyanobacterium]
MENLLGNPSAKLTPAGFVETIQGILPLFEKIICAQGAAAVPALAVGW